MMEGYLLCRFGWSYTARNTEDDHNWQKGKAASNEHRESPEMRGLRREMMETSTTATTPVGRERGVRFWVRQGLTAVGCGWTVDIVSCLLPLGF